MRQNLAQRLVDLRCLSLTSQRVANLRLDHAERRFHIAPLVVLLKEPPLIKFIVVIHLPPKVTLALPLCFLILTSHSRHTPFGRAVTALMRVSKNWKDFHAMLNHAFPKRSSQDLLFS